MEINLTEKDILDATKISILFSNLSEGSKNIAIGYLSGLSDKEMAERSGELQEA